jgi:hypothetical protein
MAFIINRKAGEGQFIRTPGIYKGTIQFPREIECTPKGDTKIKLEFVTTSGKVVDDYINSEKMWWKLNNLLAAIDPKGEKYAADGVELDFTDTQNFIAFVRKMDGAEICFAVYTETYRKQDGTEGVAVRTRPMDSSRGRKQLNPAILAQIEAAEKAAEGPDEVPF